MDGLRLLSSISTWGNRFIIAAIIQGAIITGLTLLIVAIQLSFSSTINIIQFLSLSFEGPAKWFFLGYIFYLILVVAIAVTSVFYNHLEINMGKRIRVQDHSSLDSPDWNECRWHCYNANDDICRLNWLWNISCDY